MKRLFLELGGKSATIVLDDADLAASCMIGLAVCIHAGQGCAIPTRMLLPRSRYDEGVADPRGDVPGRPYGDPQDARHVLMGPRHLRQAARPGRSATSRRASTKAPRSSSAAADAPDGLDKGCFVEPTLFADVDNSMTIAQEEIFGPVLVRHPVRRRRRRRSASPTTASYGLAGGVISGSLERSAGGRPPHPRRRR